MTAPEQGRNSVYMPLSRDALAIIRDRCNANRNRLVLTGSEGLMLLEDIRRLTVPEDRDVLPPDVTPPVARRGRARPWFRDEVG